jgi:uncharacterized membrane protein
MVSSGEMPCDRRQKSQARTGDVNEHRTAVARVRTGIHRFMGVIPFAPKRIVNILPQRPLRKA